MWAALHRRIHSGLRSKLLALVILPLLLTSAAALGYVYYWATSYTLDVLKSNVKDKLTLARHALREVQQEYQAQLKRLAESERFRRLVIRGDGAGVQRELRRLAQEKGFAFAHLTGVAGNWLHEESNGPHASSKPSPLTDRAARGLSGAALELFRFDDLVREDPLLPDRASIVLHSAEGRGDKPTEHRAMMLRLVQPVLDDQGRVAAVLDGGVLFNNDPSLMEVLRARAFAGGGSAVGAEAMVALLLERTRVGTIGAGNVGEQVATGLREAVLDRGDTWVGRDSVSGRRFVSAYGPLYDANGQRLGMLHVGLPEHLFLAGHQRAALWLLAICLGSMLLAAAIALRGARSVYRPIEEMTAVVRAIQAGTDRRIGPVRASGEIAELARQFDVMLDLVAQRNRELKQAAQTLEHKVAARTRELAQKNTDLEATVRLLQRTREQLVLAEKLSALGVLAAGIAHEINNPVAVIVGNLELLVAEIGDATRPVQREIALIHQQVDRIQRIITSLLQFARPAPSASAITEVDVNRAVDDVLPLVSHVFKKKSIAFAKRLTASGVICIDGGDLDQVLINLLLNAANAVADGGQIEVETADAGADAVVIYVRDNGKGIPSDLIAQIFDPFFTTDPRRGSGLGLSVSYGLVRRYGGDITVASTVDRGTTFAVRLHRFPVVPAVAGARADEWMSVTQGRTALPETGHDRYVG